MGGKEYLIGGDWNMTGLFFHILGIIIPIDTYFWEGLKPPTRCKYHPAWLLLNGFRDLACESSLITVCACAIVQTSAQKYILQHIYVYVCVCIYIYIQDHWSTFHASIHVPPWDSQATFDTFGTPMRPRWQRLPSQRSLPQTRPHPSLRPRWSCGYFTWWY